MVCPYVALQVISGPSDIEVSIVPECDARTRLEAQIETFGLLL
jgi:hypothetical protein